MEAFRAEPDAQEAALPIFLLPGLGATRATVEAQGYALAALRDELARFGDVSVLLHMPDVDQRSDVGRDIAGTVARLAATIVAQCGATSPVLVGYSIGGFIAFAVCRRLEAVGRPVRLLVMLDSSADYPRPPPRASAPGEARSDPIPLARRLVRAPFAAALERRRFEAARRWLSLLIRVAGSAPTAAMRTELLVAFWFEAVETYAVEPYGGRVTLIKARKSRPRITDPALGWGQLAPRLEIVVAEGDHWSMVRRPETLAELRAVMLSIA